MSAFLFEGSATQWGTPPCDSCGNSGAPREMARGVTIIMHGGDLETARQRVKAQLLGPSQKPESTPTIIQGIFATPFMEQLLREGGPVPIDWDGVNKQERAELFETPVDDFEQGYWVNVDEAVSPDNLAPDIQTLQNELPEDVRSGLNWEPGKQFFFLLTAFNPPPQPQEGYDGETVTEPSFKEVAPPHLTDDLEPEIDGQKVDDYPDVLTKNVAALIQARNSVVAAWLWRQHAATTSFAAFPIHIDPWCSNRDVNAPAAPELPGEEPEPEAE